MSKLKEIRKKLDKNNDGLISLDEYLADMPSRGPNESCGHINYHYQNFDNIYSYFKIILYKFTKFSILCIPNFVMRYYNYIDKAALLIELETELIVYGNKMREAIKKCRKNKLARFIFFTLILKINVDNNHANIVVIDIEKKTVERFEPHGSSFYFNKDSYKKNNIVNYLFVNEILPNLGLRKYEYIPPENISPKLGIQAKADAFCGMCVTISMMYLHLRLLNPDIDQKKLVKYLLKKDKNKLKNIILRYAKHIEKTLKKYK